MLGCAWVGARQTDILKEPMDVNIHGESQVEFPTGFYGSSGVRLWGGLQEEGAAVGPLRMNKI